MELPALYSVSIWRLCYNVSSKLFFVTESIIIRNASCRYLIIAEVLITGKFTFSFRFQVWFDLASRRKTDNNLRNRCTVFCARAWYIVILFRDVLCHVNWIITTVVQHNIPEPPVIAVHRTALIKKIVVLTCLCATVSMLSWLLQGTESKMPRDTIKTRTECPKGKKKCILTAFGQCFFSLFTSNLFVPHRNGFLPNFNF